MRRQEVTATIDSYLSKKERSKSSGKLWVELNLNQGGFGAPHFYKFVKDDDKPLTEKIRFDIVE